MNLNKKLFLLLYLFFYFKQNSQNSQNAIFDKIDSRTLSNSFITAIYQDQKGYLWVGTLSGLNRYNGYEFEKYRCFQKDSSSLSNPVITAIHQLNPDKIIIGTRKGLSIYNYHTNSFLRSKIDTNVLNYKLKNNVTCIATDLKGQKIIGTADGLCLYNEKENAINEILSNKYNLLSGWIVQCVCFDRLGNLWAGVKKTVNNKTVSRVFKCSLDKKNAKEIEGLEGGTNGFLGISEDYLGNIWVGVDDGLVSISTSNLKQNKYYAPNKFYSGISYTHSKDNTIWQCYWSFGLTSFDIDKKEFKVYQNNPDNPKSLLSNKCWALYKDENDILWVGSDVGLQKLTNRKPNLQVVKRNYQDLANSFLNNMAISVLASREHNNLICLGIDGEGFALYNNQNKTTFSFGPNAKNKNEERFVNQFIEDDSGTVYIGGQNLFQKLTINKGGYNLKSYYPSQSHYVSCMVKNPVNTNDIVIAGIGEIMVFEKNSEKIKYMSQLQGVKSVFTCCFFVNNSLYFGFSGGLLKLNPKNYSSEKIALPDFGNITSAGVISDSVVYLSSKHLGLVKFNPKTNKYTIQYKNKSDFFNESKSSVVYKNCLWMATDNGLVKWNYTTNEITEITSNDGLPSEILNQLDFLDGYF